MQNSNHYEARLRVKAKQPQFINHKKSSSVPLTGEGPFDYTKYNKIAAKPGEFRGKYSREMLFVTTQLPSSRGLCVSVTTSPSRPSTAELTRKSLVRCASLSDGFQRVVDYKDEGKSALQFYLASELQKSRPGTTISKRRSQLNSIQSNPYLQKLPRKADIPNRFSIRRAL